jgi:hypothetical protein
MFAGFIQMKYPAGEGKNFDRRIVFAVQFGYISWFVRLICRGRGVTGARGGRIAEMRVRFPSSPLVWIEDFFR